MIRDIKKEDIPFIYELGKKYDPLFSRHYHLEDYLNNKVYVLRCFECSGDVSGFLICTKMFETVEILLVFVDNNYRRKSIATKLINSLLDENVKELLLEVSVANERAINLYKKLGFETISIREKYYSGIDAWVMKKVVK